MFFMENISDPIEIWDDKVFNKTATSNVDAPLKAQKAQKLIQILSVAFEKDL